MRVMADSRFPSIRVQRWSVIGGRVQESAHPVKMGAGGRSRCHGAEQMVGSMVNGTKTPVPWELVWISAVPEGAGFTDEKATGEQRPANPWQYVHRAARLSVGVALRGQSRMKSGSNPPSSMLRAARKR